MILVGFFSLLTLVNATPQAASSRRCTGTISSLSDINSAVQCTTVNINAFTVPAGKTFSLNLLHGTTVNVLGDIQFGNVSWVGPLFEVTGNDITFNGNGKIWDGGGPFYWVNEVAVTISFNGVHVVNSPERAVAVNNPGPLTISGVTVDNSEPLSSLDKLIRLTGRNTDGFDVSGDDVVIKGCTVINQDDCLAINRGKNIVFQDNYCDSGHGISVGSISSNVVVDTVIIRGNTVVNSQQGFRIKTKRDATNSRVSNVKYSDNTAKNITNYGILITQSYPTTIGTPGTGVIISDISFSSGETEVSVANEADRVAINCGSGTCTGTWDWSKLVTSGGQAGTRTNVPSALDGYTL
ncbi:pectin lyase fold/virulence factor [Chiua virens]|nr:pectin lyase fold/virulence factor [Chiua virens]